MCDGTDISLKLWSPDDKKEMSKLARKVAIAIATQMGDPSLSQSTPCLFAETADNDTVLPVSHNGVSEDLLSLSVRSEMSEGPRSELMKESDLVVQRPLLTKSS